MSKKAAKRRRALAKREAANLTQRRLARRSALERHRTVGGYASLLLAGATFLTAAAMWNTFDASPVSAQVSGVQSEQDIRATAERLFVARVAELPPEPPVPQVLPEFAQDVLPEQSGSAQQADAQALTPSMQDVTVAPVAAPGSFAARDVIHNVNITFYDCANQGFCGAMYNGRKVYEGAAACSWNLPIGTRFVIVGDPTHRIYTCEDRGLLANTWVDIFWYYPADGYNWQGMVGRYGTIEIVWMP